MGNGVKTYDSVLAAKYLMALANEKGRVLNTTKVQKLLFIAYGEYLSMNGSRLLNEAPQAWPFGPVFPRTRSRIDYSVIQQPDAPEFSDIRSNEEVNVLFSHIIDKYASFTASQLSDWSHTEGSPWEKTTKERSFKWGNVIDDNYIKEYFSNVAV